MRFRHACLRGQPSAAGARGSPHRPPTGLVSRARVARTAPRPRSGDADSTCVVRGVARREDQASLRVVALRKCDSSRLSGSLNQVGSSNRSARDRTSRIVEYWRDRLVPVTVSSAPTVYVSRETTRSRSRRSRTPVCRFWRRRSGEDLAAKTESVSTPECADEA